MFSLLLSLNSFKILGLSPNTELSKTLCPISGGFQISQILDLKNNEVLCEPHVYSTLESECMSGEGILWTFLQPQCNPFVQNYRGIFMIFSTTTTTTTTNNNNNNNNNSNGTNLICKLFSSF
ncbi:unnamed protein product [Schistosoma curassoni]|uniref:Uncharacterized protein n=1 Tax=Schistosoma curassoni TaxID=6186 RepID=A0A3P8FBS4_9TREM|nr:unnamed protein product [Schistosoma curassoni]